MGIQRQERPEEHKRREREEEVPPSPVLRRRGTHPGAGADSPSGPFPDSTSEPMKRAREDRKALDESGKAPVEEMVD